LAVRIRNKAMAEQAAGCYFEPKAFSGMKTYRDP
jgi:hypothetical protein